MHVGVAFRPEIIPILSDPDNAGEESINNIGSDLHQSLFYFIVSSFAEHSHLYSLALCATKVYSIKKPG